ncbi:unnamed protein product [Tenebrio molitor]|nr:unnamed protein product [Tenebrio molitor]
MEDFEVKCCVCLTSTQDAAQLDSCDFKSESLISKLQNVVPEVEWAEQYRICEPCGADLNAAYEFRNRCIQLDFERKQALVPKILDNKLFICNHCGTSVNNKTILTEHIQTHHSPQIDKKSEPVQIKKFECGTCDKSYSTQKVLKAHSKKCKNEQVKVRKSRSFSCEVCNLVLTHAKLVVEHCVSEHSMDRKVVKPYTCDECPMRFSSSANLIQHKKYHDGSRSHICSFCGKSYITKSDLTVHEYTHFNRRNYKCEVCGKAFNTNKNLRSHILVVHTNSSLWKYGCDVCSRRFPLKSGYEQHMRRHAGDKQFVCHICAKSFVSRSELQKHMGYHSMVKPFRCGHCDKAYKEKRLYEIHLTKSHGIGDAKIPVKVKKFACHVCPNTFFDKQKLERHLRTHSGVKPYVCRNCDKKFSDKYYLKQHRKNVHNLDDEDELEVQFQSFT